MFLSLFLFIFNFLQTDFKIILQEENANNKINSDEMITMYHNLNAKQEKISEL